MSHACCASPAVCSNGIEFEYFPPRLKLFFFFSSFSPSPPLRHCPQQKHRASVGVMPVNVRSLCPSLERSLFGSTETERRWVTGSRKWKLNVEGLQLGKKWLVTARQHAGPAERLVSRPFPHHFRIVSLIGEWLIERFDVRATAWSSGLTVCGVTPGGGSSLRQTSLQSPRGFMLSQLSILMSVRTVM